MAIEYRKFYLKPGQQPPINGSTGVSLPSGGIVWIGEKGTFLPNDPKTNQLLQNSVMDASEIAEYNKAIGFNVGQTVIIGTVNYNIIQRLENGKYLVAEEGVIKPVLVTKYENATLKI